MIVQLLAITSKLKGFSLDAHHHPELSGSLITVTRILYQCHWKTKRLTTRLLDAFTKKSFPLTIVALID